MDRGGDGFGERPPTDSLLDAGSTTIPGLPPVPEQPASGERPADARNLAPAPAAAPGELKANATATRPAPPAAAMVDDDQAVGLREAAEHHLPGITLNALRFARANDPTFPAPADKRGAELLYRAGDLKKWARNRPRAAPGRRAGRRPGRTAQSPAAPPASAHA